MAMQVVQEAESKHVSEEHLEQVAEKEKVEGLLSKAFHAHQLATRSVSLVNLLDQPAVLDHVSGDSTVSVFQAFLCCMTSNPFSLSFI